jgi:hypothetical protein
MEMKNNIGIKPLLLVASMSMVMLSCSMFETKEETKKTTKGAEFSLANCVDVRTAETDRFLDWAFDEVNDQLPIDIRPYLAGFCLPKNKDNFEKLYLYLVAKGAAHSRLTLVKYDKLLDIYSRAGVDLAIQKDTFRRSIETLDDDLQVLAEERRDGAEKLIENYPVDEVKKMQELLPAGYAKLEAEYRAQARPIMGEALNHSISSTFYLSRSTYVIKALMEFTGIKKRQDESLLQAIIERPLEVASKLKNYIEDFWTIKFIMSKQDDIGEMLLSSTYSIKTLTQDIEDLPRPNSEQAERELYQLRKENKVELNDFEEAFEANQQDQLAKAAI